MASRHIEHSGHAVHRLHTNELEIGITEAVQKHVSRHVVPTKPVSQRKLDFEHARPRWIREMLAEATGVFFYVYPGIASQAAFMLADAEPAFGSILQIGFAYAMGIAFAIIVNGSTSGGHFNPAVTISLAIYSGFPWKKVPYYIFAQILGAFMAGLFLMGTYHTEIMAFKAATPAGMLNSVNGPGGILCAFPKPTQNLGQVFLQEFIVDMFLALVIWSVLDPANPFVAASTAPFVIGMAYGVMVWGFGANTLATNTARDLGTRIIAAIFFGGSAFDRYSPIGIFTNIPATILAVGFYEVVLRDSMQKIAKGHGEHEEGEDGLIRHLTKTGTIEQGIASSMARKESDGTGLSGSDGYTIGRKDHSPV